ncbi:MAG: relaxase/mobilization nuclease domain-containing protein [Sediminibacterium sp.]|nr:relaxase/mobilization nuclease domain-containing protein [Sediminibacterium sp.]
MIGKISIGKSLRHCISYALEDKLDLAKQAIVKDRAELLSFNLCFGDKKELIQQFNEVRYLNPKLSKPVMHITLSLSPGELLDKPTLHKMVEDCAKELGFEKNQFIAVTHKDTGHQHLHIVVNRVGLDGKTLNDSNNYKKIAAYCRKMELKFELKQVLSPRQFLSKEMRNIPRMDIRKEAMKNDIRLTLIQSRNYAEFEHQMKQKGYEVIRGRGIAFRDEKKMYAKGSELGYSLAKIEKILEQTLTQKQALILREVQKENAFKQQSKSVTPSLSKSMEQDRKMDYSKALEILLRAERDYSQTPHELLQKKRKKKYHQSLHL